MASRRAQIITNHVAGSVWANVEQAPADPILGLSTAFKADKFPQKMNLGVGAYRGADGKPLVLNVVKKAEAALLEKVKGGELNKEYLPMSGYAAFKEETTKLILGKSARSITEKRVAVIQSLSGTGALRTGGIFIQRFMAGRTIYLPTPTWGNHNAIFKNAGVPIKQYRYINKQMGLDFDGMIADLKGAPDGSIILLHACAHNPTGVDPTMAQWKIIADTMQAKNMIPFFDSAYQGYASGDLATDALAVQHFEQRGFEMFIAQSYSKNFGLYGERIGALSLVTSDAETAKRAVSQLELIVRPMYSNPPKHGAEIVAHCLKDPALFAEWQGELKAMSDRVIDMRALLVKELKAKGTPGDWSHVTSQIGMFSFTGIPKDKVQKLVKDHHIYMTGNGRISIAGINPNNVGYLADCIHKVMTE